MPTASPAGFGAMTERFAPRDTSSAAPPTSLKISGRPAAAASVAATGQPSKNEFSRNASAAVSRVTASEFPRKWMRRGPLFRSRSARALFNSTGSETSPANTRWRSSR